MYEMPSDIKEIPSNQWVWILRERLETAHKIVKEHTEKKMVRKKKYHDAKVEWSIFEPGEKVYVYFPVRKTGCSPKLTSFWKGPFVIEKKLSDFLYIVACGFRGKGSVIHCNRMRKCKSQILTGEEQELSVERNEIECEADNLHAIDAHLCDNDLESACADLKSRALRRKRAPAWHDDFVVEYKI